MYVNMSLTGYCMFSLQNLHNDFIHVFQVFTKLSWPLVKFLFNFKHVVRLSATLV